jgi:hypothetical protein
MPRKVQMRSMKKPRTKKTRTKKPVTKTKGSKKKRIKKKPSRVSKKKKNLRPREVSKKQTPEPLEYAKGNWFWRRNRNRAASVSLSPIEKNPTYIPNNRHVLNFGYNLYSKTTDNNYKNHNNYYDDGEGNHYEMPVPVYRNVSGSRNPYQSYSPDKNYKGIYTPYNRKSSLNNSLPSVNRKEVIKNLKENNIPEWQMRRYQGLIDDVVNGNLHIDALINTINGETEYSVG